VPAQGDAISAALSDALATAMLKTLKDLFDAFKSAGAAPPAPQREHALQLATAVLLVEVMRSESGIGAEERRVATAALKDRFSLEDDELARLLELAEQTAQEAYDYHRFTSRINEAFDAEDKVRIVEEMWRVAYADGHLGAHEQHVISRIADLLHVPHQSYIAAKIRAKAASEAGTP
jgi:uncharacterized tellurite resistance protein B-like protein